MQETTPNNGHPMTPAESFSIEDLILQGNAPLTADAIRSMRVTVRMIRNTSQRCFDKSRYLSMIFTSTEKAAMWLGKVLEVLNEPYPYDGKTPGPVADDTDQVLEFPPNLKTSLRIKGCREILGRLVYQIREWCIEPITGELYEEHGKKTLEDYWQKIDSLRNAHMHLQEARMDFGMELGASLKTEAVTV